MKEFKIVETFGGPCIDCKRKLGALHKRGCKFGIEGRVGISGNMSLKKVGVTVMGKRDRQFVAFPK